MKSFIKKIFENEIDDKVRQYFIRFGKGDYKRRFLINFNKGKKIKIKSSFEYANDFVNFVRDNKDVKFSGKILAKERIEKPNEQTSIRKTLGEPKKRGASFTYEISQSSINEFENIYFYLLDANSSDIVLKIKKNLPKPGKDANKIDNKFCSLELDLKYWDKFKEAFFWDIPSGKKVSIEHEIIISDIEIPKDEKDPSTMREKAIRKGNIIRKIDVDGKEIVKEKNFNA